jgi:flagellar hook-length control protein FliK
VPATSTQSLNISQPQTSEPSDTAASPAEPTAETSATPNAALQTQVATLVTAITPQQPARSPSAKQNTAEKKAEPANAAQLVSAGHAQQTTPPADGAKTAAIPQDTKAGEANRDAAAFAAAMTQHSAQTALGKDAKPDMALAAATTAPTPTASAPPAPAPALVPQSTPVLIPPEAVAATIARKAADGVNRFEIRLDPAELGRLDVTIEIDETGHTRAHIRAERPEALELLQRDAKGMEQALRQAGLQTDQSSLSFSLAERHKQDGGEHAGQGRRAKFHAVLPPDEIAAGVLQGRTNAATGLDLRV